MTAGGRRERFEGSRMIYQLRDYTVNQGAMDAWVKEWTETVLPLRRKWGFEVVGAWVLENENRFVWIIGYDGDFEARDAEYYASPEREGVDPDPARHLALTRTHLMRSVLA